ncbi:lipopolysaccharide biosynthesis protein [Flavobacteriaceae bacterium]|nr:lipopolysaccharide biosynthesis protein [Flavobacteriaceae bacterium]
MKNIIKGMFQNFGIKSQRTKKIVNHVGLSVLYKGGSIIATFLLVPLTINYLTIEDYGIWLTLSSFIAWFSFFDIGLGNGLRNKFAEAKANENFILAQCYVSSAYYTIAIVSLVLIFAFLVVNMFIDWTIVFNADDSLKPSLYILMPIVFSFFCLQLVLKLITTIYTADQKPSVQGKIGFLTQIGSLFLIWILTKISQGSLVTFGVVFSGLPVFILLLFNIFAFSKTYHVYKPKFSLWKLEYLKEIFGLGIKFFIAQIAALVLFSTDNFIISKLFSPAEVVPYNIAFKYFSIITMLYTILVTPFWSSFTEAYVKKEYSWIKNSVNNILKIWLLVPVALMIMVLLAKPFYNFWVGDEVVISVGLNLSMALFVLLVTFNMVFVQFINGVGKIKLQLITSLISMTINIPLSIYFAKNLDLGISGVIIATCFSLGYSVILRPLQYYKIINNTAKGIWNK